MLGVIGQLLPLAVAVALSSIPILAVLVILLESTRFAVPTLFVIGYILGLLVMTALFALGSRAIPARESAAAQPVVGAAEVVIGIALAAYVAILGIRRRRTPPREERPRWMLALGRLRPLPALGLGLALNVRPKSILLAAAAGLVIGSTQLTPSSYAIVLAVYIVIGASSVGGPAAFALIRPTKAQGPLASAEHWLLRNRGTVATIVGVVVGIVIVGNGLTRF